MSLLQRMERAQQAKAAAEAAAAGRTSLRPTSPSRQEPLRTGRPRSPRRQPSHALSRRRRRPAALTQGHGRADRAGPLDDERRRARRRRRSCQATARSSRPASRPATSCCARSASSCRAKSSACSRPCSTRRTTTSGAISKGSSNPSTPTGAFPSRVRHASLIEWITPPLASFGPLRPLLAPPPSPRSWSTARHIYIERGGKIERVDASS